MLLKLLLVELALLIAVGGGWWLGATLVRRAHRDDASVAAEGASERDGAAADPDAESDRLSDSIGFVGGTYGILLGLLLVFAVGHFVDTRQASRDEAVTTAALFTAVNPFPAESRDPLRHDIVCFMRSTATDDWQAARAGDLTGSENTSAYAATIQRQIEELPQDEAVEASNHYFVTEEVLDVSKYRQMMLLYSLPEIPPVVWFVVLVSAFVFTTLMVRHLGTRRRLARLAVLATGLVLVSVIGSLVLLDSPYVGLGSALRPVAMDAALTRLQDAYPEPASVWEPCERLAVDEAG